MLAKAMAKESGANFINLHISTLSSKWFGESQKLVHALFTFARKIQPCIIFIDEIDSFMRERSSDEHEATGMMKAEFMTLWDGLNTNSSNDRIVILGATNRMDNIDPAFLRRLAKRYLVSLPSLLQRSRVLEVILKGINLNQSLDLDRLAALTVGYSCSDLKELCRNSVVAAANDSIINQGTNDTESVEPKVRPICLGDFLPFIQEFGTGIVAPQPLPLD